MKTTPYAAAALALSFTLLFGCTSLQENKEKENPADKALQAETKTPPVAEPNSAADMVVLEERDVAMLPTAAIAKMSVSSNFDGNQSKREAAAGRSISMPAPTIADGNGILLPPSYRDLNTESYTPVVENSFINSANDPLSTFSIDVDTASYANIRRFINQGSLPPTGAVRIEEMINYFNYQYPEPANDPFSISIEPGPCPWKKERRLVKIGIQAKTVPAEALPPSNLIFLIDVSGSMRNANKLPLLKKSLLMLVDTMRDTDRIGLVVYAGSDRVILHPTPGTYKEQIRAAIQKLGAGGSTHGSSGIHTAYQLAEQSFIPGGNNRVILASDGDFNVGVTTRGELKKLIEEKRNLGVYLTVLGFGMGNYQDDTMETLADTGNGNYAYIDSLLEAKKVLLKEGAGTLFTLARDVKIQVEFNPALVGAYRLIGYENRALADEDFRDDKKDAGEIGLGHSVTALYEIIPAGSSDVPEVDSRKYSKITADDSNHSGELLTVKLRYKPAGSKTSRLMSKSGIDQKPGLDSTSADFRFTAAVAGFGMVLKESEYKGDISYPALIELARSGRGKDLEGYRAELIRLLESAELIKL